MTFKIELKYKNYVTSKSFLYVRIVDVKICFIKVL